MKKLRLIMIVGMISVFLSMNVSAASPGAIAFVGFNADGSDGFAFVLLTGANAGSVVYFTDNEWNGSSFTTGEGIRAWTSPAGGLPAGTVITISGLTTSPTASAGLFSIESGSMNLSGSGEAIYAYQGTDANTPSVFLAVISNGTLANTGASLTNTGLSEGTTAVVFPTSRDVLVYDGSLSFANEAEAHTAIGNTSNWIYEASGTGDQSIDTVRPDFPADVPTGFTISVPTAITLRGLSARSAGAGLPVMGLALAGLLVGAVVVRRK